MDIKYLKIIFTIIMIILTVAGIYISMCQWNAKAIITSEIQSNKETIISNSIRIGLIQFDNINPILSNNKNVQDISRLIFEPLFSLTEDYKLEGVLAKECTKIKDKTYIVKLNNNIIWHDGKKFDSLDVIFTINMLKKLGAESIYYYNIEDIKEVQEIDEYTIKIILDKDISYFEYNLIFPIISSKYFNEENLKSGEKNIKPVGTGMFYISDVSNESILLKKNNQKNNAENVKIDTITLKKYNSLLNTIKAFKSEKIDMFTKTNNIEEYLKNRKYNSYEYINREYNYLALNCNSKILSDENVRKAIAYSIDKEEISKKVFNNNCRISSFPLDFGSFVNDLNNEKITYDTNMAKNLLIDNEGEYLINEWKKNNEDSLIINLNIVVNSNDINNVKVASNIKEQLNKIGINIEVKKVDNREYEKYLKNRNYDMIIVKGIYGYSPSLEKYFGENNLANYHNQEINMLLKESELSNNEIEIKQKYAKIKEIYNQEVPYISLYYDTSLLVYSTALKGRVSPNSYNVFYGIENWYREYDK